MSPLRLSPVLLSGFLAGCLGYSALPPGPAAPVPPAGSVDLGLTPVFRRDPCLDAFAPEFEAAENDLAVDGIVASFDALVGPRMECSDEPGAERVATAYYGKRIVFNVADLKALDPWSIEHVIMHETGHMLGAAHVRSVNSVMYPDVTDSLELTEDDLAAVSAQDFPIREPGL